MARNDSSVVTHRHSEVLRKTTTTTIVKPWLCSTMQNKIIPTFGVAKLTFFLPSGCSSYASMQPIQLKFSSSSHGAACTGHRGLVGSMIRAWGWRARRVKIEGRRRRAGSDKRGVAGSLYTLRWWFKLVLRRYIARQEHLIYNTIWRFLTYVLSFFSATLCSTRNESDVRQMSITRCSYEFIF